MPSETPPEEPEEPQPRDQSWDALLELIGGRELVADNQCQAEIALLSRIRELSKNALPEDLHILADTYVLVRHYSVAPGTYMPDNRHTDMLSAKEDKGAS